MTHTNTWRARAVSGALVASIAVCVSSGAPAGAAATQHMYVTDNARHAVLRFPMKGGIPGQQPDAVIGGLGDPRGVAIGPDGRLYVVDRSTHKLLIYEPAPGSGSKPSHVLKILHEQGNGAVTVDPLGYVYVTWAQVCTTEGFYCGLASIFSPLARGLHFVRTYSFGGGPGGAVVRSLSVNSSHALVDVLGSQGATVWFGAPGSQGSAYFLFCGATDEAGTVWGPGNTLYETDLGGTQPPSQQQIVVVPDYTKGNINNCPTFYTITSATVPLKDPFSIVASGGLIYVTGAYTASVGSALVFVFDPTKPGSQTPVALISGAASRLRSPQGIAIGP
jgi:NHL repeat-containing protein